MSSAQTKTGVDIDFQKKRHKKFGSRFVRLRKKRNKMPEKLL